MEDGATLSSRARLWRTAFLTLRDETQALSSPALRSVPVLHLLNRVILSQSNNLIEAVPNLPSYEVTSDIILLIELAQGVSDAEGSDSLIQTFVQLSRFIQLVCSRVSLVLNPSSWALSLKYSQRVVDVFFGKGNRNGNLAGDADVVQATQQCLETVGSLVGVYQRTMGLSENKQLLDFLQGVILSLQIQSVHPSSSISNPKRCKYLGVYEVQKLALTLISDVYSRVGTSLPIDIWQSTIEVLREVLDSLASEGPLSEGNVMPMFYYSALHCLHLVAKDLKGSLAAHMSSFIVVLKRFLDYGVTNQTRFVMPETSPMSNISQSNTGRYRPPHLRKDRMLRQRDEGSFPCLDPGLSSYHTSSDSDYSSDGDGFGRDTSSSHCDKVRVVAVLCIQDLCRAEPKLVNTQLTTLLPCIDVLQPRKYEANLMSCLLFDPYSKARLTAASTIATILDKSTSVFLQVAELKDPSKFESFTSLSSSLGQILVQLHSGILYLVKREMHRGLLASLFKVLIPLISCTPYSRMPTDLLASVVCTVLERIQENILLQHEDGSLLANAINCLTVALSFLPPSVCITNMLMEEVNAGFAAGKKRSGIVSTLFRYSDPVISPLISIEALQALRAVAHTYPSTMFVCWKHVSSIVYRIFSPSPDAQARLVKNTVRDTSASNWEKVLAAAIKVLDECLRACSGFKGTEDLSDDRYLLGPFTSDYIKAKVVSSAPFHGLEGPCVSKDEVELCSLGCELWSEALVKHMPLILRHNSAMVRAAAVTCFAGLTSPVFCSLQKDEQGLILSSSLYAISDDAPSVRSAACRALGIIACFPHVIQRIEIVDKLVRAVVHSTNDPLVSVRITASWALANMCDSLSHCVNILAFSTDSKGSTQVIPVLIDIALRLSKDNDKIKANAVRALGNLARCIRFDINSGVHAGVDHTRLSPIRCTMKDLQKLDSLGECSNICLPACTKPSHWLEKIVQALISCVTTGNVKVQWNVCHALSNLFLNESLNLQDMNWAPSVFSTLLRLLHNSINYKIKIQAAAALAAPATVTDYGTSFYDVLESMMQLQESLGSDQISTPSNFRYKVSLEKQITATLLHLIGLASTTGHQPIQMLLAQKWPSLEVWLKSLCSSLGEVSVHRKNEDMYANEKKVLVVKVLKSLIKVFEDSHNQHIAAKCHEFLNSMG